MADVHAHARRVRARDRSGSPIGPRSLNGGLSAPAFLYSECLSLFETLLPCNDQEFAMKRPMLTGPRE
jgi:hypothetical protein